MKKILVAILLACASPQARAALPAAPSRTIVTAAGGTIVYFNFKTTSSSHIEVFVAGGAPPTYSVTLYPNQDSSPGGYVTFTSPPAVGAVITVQRTVPLSQPSTWIFNKPLENALDYITMIAQQIQRDGGGGGGGLGPLPTCSPGEYLTTSGGVLSCSPDLVGSGGSGSGLPSDPAPCPSGQFVTDQNANGVLSCSPVSYSALTGTPTWTWANISGKPATFPATTPVASATALALTPTLCPFGQSARGIDVNGNATGCYIPPGTYSYNLAPATTGVIGGVKGGRCANGYVLVGHDTDGSKICEAIGAVLSYIVTTDGNPPADPNQTYWIDASTGSTPAAGSPTFAPAAGTYAGTQSVAISSSTSGAVVCYTSDGSTPAAATAGTCSAGLMYSAPVSVSASSTLRALATKAGYTNSAVATATYTITALPAAAPPTFNPVGGLVVAGTVVTVSSTTPSSVVRCTHDGSVPTGSSPITTTFTVNATETARCLAQASGYTNSAAAQQVYTVSTADVTPPTVTGFALASTSPNQYVQITTATATDDTGVTGWCLTYDDPTPPTLTTCPLAGSNWPTTAPTFIYFGSTGAHTARLWVKDAAGNISTSAATSSTTITVTDSVAPSLVSFTAPSTSSSLTVPITMSATDNVGVTGYWVHEYSPGPWFWFDNTGWTGTPPTSYTFSGPGSKTLYGTAKDVAGNFSTTLIQYVTVTLAQAATPTFSPPAGAVTSGTVVTPSSITSGATLRCTTDGSTPTGTSPVTVTTTITAPTTVKCIAQASGYSDSAVGTASYTMAVAATPTITPNGGTISGATSVTLACTSPSPTIRYTLDGSTPTGSSTAYSTALSVSSTTTVKAICQSSGYTDSAVASATFTLGTASLALPNPGFESAIGTVEGDNWWAGSGGVGTAGYRGTPGLVGSSAGYVSAVGDDGGYPASAASVLYNRTTKTAIDASSGHLKFKIKPTAITGSNAYIQAHCYNGSGSDVTTTTNAKNAVMLWGGAVGSAADDTSIKFTPVVNTVRDVDWNLAAFLGTICTWANVSKVILEFVAADGTMNETAFVIDDFTTK